MTTRTRKTPNPRRRSVLGALAGGLALGRLPTARAADTASPAAAPRLALLIGNRAYPDGQDLPPIHKNVHDLTSALQKRGFTVTDGLDEDLAGARALVESFAATVRAAPANAIVLFYFSGHGAQVDAENLLVSAHVNPQSRPETLIRGSLTLVNDVLGALPKRPEGLTIAVVDACRTSLVAMLQGDGLNQVEAPPGCLIAFATGAGKPAIAPADDKRNTFYTASLVKLLNTASDQISFSDLFRLVKTDVQQTMLNYPVKLLREFAQFPFIAENTRVQPLIALQPEAAMPVAGEKAESDDEAADRQRLLAALWPADVLRLATEFLQKHPQSPVAGSAQVARDGATEAAQILRRNDVRLYRSAFQAAPELPPALAADLGKAGRGDKDAAARLGRWYLRKGPAEASRYEGWMQYASALGNGIASYDLALYYRRLDQPLLASQFEGHARALGYTPPPSLDNSRK